MAYTGVRVVGAHAWPDRATPGGAWRVVARPRKAPQVQAWLGICKEVGWPAGTEVQALGTHARPGAARLGTAWLGMARLRMARRGPACRGNAWKVGWLAASGVRGPGTRARLGRAAAVLVPASLGWSVRRVARPVKAWTPQGRGA